MRSRDGRLIPGITGSKPPHFLTEAEKNKAPDIASMWIDVGASTIVEAQEEFGIRPGAPVAPDVTFSYYVDVSLQTKVARDEESGEMMQIVMDGRVMDFGYLYCGWSGWTWQLAGLFKDPGTYASNLQKSMKMMTKTYKMIINKFMD